MDKIGIRGVIQFFFLEGKTAKEIHERMFPILGDSCPCYESVRLWVNEFKRGRISIKDAPRSGGPRTVVTPKTINKVHDMVLSDRQIKMREIAEATGISIERIHTFHKMGATFAHCRAKASSYANVSQLFGSVQEESTGFHTAFYDHG